MPTDAIDSVSSLGKVARDLATQVRGREAEVVGRYGGALGTDETKRYLRTRSKAVERVVSLGAVLDHSDNCLYYGALSPGCELCRRGSWDCVYVTHACTRSCFFCAQSRTSATPLPNVGGEHFTAPAGLVAHERRRGNDGCALSGGDPLCRPDDSLAMIEAMRSSFGPSFRIWLYTNGDLLTPDLLTRLKDAGLDELRFNIAGKGYDVKALELARDIIDRIAVEIPMIPEDEERLRRMLPVFKDVGVDHINLHELVYTPDNVEQLSERGYLCMTGASPMDRYVENRPVLGSELTALRLLEHNIRSGIRLPINICTYCYKVNVQIPALRRRDSRLVVRPHERVGYDGMCETLLVKGPPPLLTKVESFLLGRGVARDALRRQRDRIYVHPRHARDVKELEGLPGVESGLLRTQPTQGPERNDVELRL